MYQQRLAALSRALRSRWTRVSSVAVMLCAVMAVVPATAFAQSGYGGAAGMSGSMDMMGSAQPANGSDQSTMGAAGQMVIHIRNFSFGSPLTVPAGTTVQWVNEDSVAHTVTADSGAFDSSSLAPGATFQFTFSQAGDFPYYCRFHGGPGGQGMASRITVTAQGTAPSVGQQGQQGQASPGNNYGNNMAGSGYGSNMQGYGGNYGSNAPSYNNTCPNSAYSSGNYGAYAPSYGGNNYSSKGSSSYGKGYSAPKSYGRQYAPYRGTMRMPGYSGGYGSAMRGRYGY